RVRVAVGAVEVAAPGRVPDDDRLLVAREVQQVRRAATGRTAVAERVLGPDRAVEQAAHAQHGADATGRRRALEGGQLRTGLRGRYGLAPAAIAARDRADAGLRSAQP